VTTYRHDVPTAEHTTYLREVFTKACQDFGATLAECNGQDNHMHLLAGYPPKAPITALVNSLKGVSAAGPASGTTSAPTASTYGRLPTSPPPAAAHPWKSSSTTPNNTAPRAADPGLNARA
jgi:Transposase IS200 like